MKNPYFVWEKTRSIQPTKAIREAEWRALVMSRRGRSSCSKRERTAKPEG